MARSYTAGEGGTGKFNYKSWNRGEELQSSILKQKMREELNALRIEKDPNDIMARKDRRSAEEYRKYLEDIKKGVRQYENVKGGDLSLFEPPVNKTSGNASISIQLSVYEIAKKNGVPLNKENSSEQLWQKYGNDRNRETIVLTDADGNRMFAATGWSNNVSIETWLPLVDLMKGSDAWHNHPVEEGRVWGGAPSAGDFDSFFTFRLASSTISTKEGTYELRLSPNQLRRTKDWTYEDAAREGKWASDQVANAWRSTFEKYRKENNLSEDDNVMKNPLHATNFFRLANQALANVAKSGIGMGFKFTPRPEYSKDFETIEVKPPSDKDYD